MPYRSLPVDGMMPGMTCYELACLRRPGRDRGRNGPLPHDTSPSAQRRRAVKRWMGNAREWTLRVRIPRRDRRIATRALDGASTRVIGRIERLSGSTVWKILVRTLRWTGFRWVCKGVLHANVSKGRIGAARPFSAEDHPSTGTSPTSTGADPDLPGSPDHPGSFRVRATGYLVIPIEDDLGRPAGTIHIPPRHPCEGYRATGGSPIFPPGNGRG